MEKKYICENCGKIWYLKSKEIGKEMCCPICLGKVISEEQIKEKEELTNLINEDKDDSLTPEQDAGEIIEEYIVERMRENITKEGNDKVWYMIENTIISPLSRIKYRQYFFLAGGVCPESEDIIK